MKNRDSLEQPNPNLDVPSVASNKTSGEYPETLEELCDYILRYASQIAVREQDGNGRWGSYFLTELTPQKAISHVLRFVRVGKIPTRLKTEEEIILHREGRI